MRGHRYHNIGRIPLLVRPHDFEEAAREPVSEGCNPVILQQDDGPSHLRGINTVASGKIEMVEVLAAEMTERSRAFEGHL